MPLQAVRVVAARHSIAWLLAALCCVSHDIKSATNKRLHEQISLQAVRVVVCPAGRPAALCCVSHDIKYATNKKHETPLCGSREIEVKSQIATCVDLEKSKLNHKHGA